jgi:predicted permease
MTQRVLLLLIRLLPPERRERLGEEILATHRARAAERRSAPGNLLFGLREVAGMTGLVLALRYRVGSRQGTGRGGGAWRSAAEGGGRNLRIALRSLRRSPGFALTALLILALGIGATIAIFSAANAFFFRPLPFRDPGRLVMLYETNPEFGWTDTQAAPANLLDWREQVDAFHDVGGYTEFLDPATYVREGEPEILRLARVTGNLFDVLGVRAHVGRTFTWEETWDGNDDVVLLGHELWLSHFGGDPGVAGKSMEFLWGTLEIVGVLPPGFSFPNPEAQLWTPVGWAPAEREAVWFRRAHFVRAVARLESGVTLEEADSQLQVVVGRLQREYPETNRVMGAGMMPLRSFLVKEVRTPVLVLAGAVGLLLLLACINVANLILVRAAARSRETALRSALGAGRLQAVGAMLGESVVLATLGGGAGLALGWTGVRAAGRLSPLGIAGATELALDARVVLFTLAAAGLSAVLSGVAPALLSRAGHPHEALKEGGRIASQGRRGSGAVSLLVAAQVALALLLVTGAGLMVRSVDYLRNADPGFRTGQTLAFQFTLPAARYQARDDVLAFYDAFLERVRALPGVEGAGTVGSLPLTGPSWSSQFQAEGWPPERVGFEILHRRADRGYFEAVGTPLLRGRWFEPTDLPDGPLVVLVNETFARQHFPGEDPIGQRIAYDRAANETSTWYEIVGIVGDQAQVNPGVPPRAEVFENARQDWARTAWVVVRGGMEPITLVPGIRNLLKEMDPLIPLAAVRPLREVWRTSMAREEFLLSLLSAFGLAALLLAGVGVYGVTAQAARRRTQEMGIRMALGAQAADVLGLMLRQGVAVVGAGLAVGYTGAILATRSMTSMLYGVEPNDPGTLGAVGALLAAVALAASYLPAHRATRVDPVRSLRGE